MQKEDITQKSPYLSRDISWLHFNERVLAQVKKRCYTFGQRLRFMSIISKNTDEFFIIRVGSLYNYIDYNKGRIDYSGLSVNTFCQYLLEFAAEFFREFNQIYTSYILPQLPKYGIYLLPYESLSAEQKERCDAYFESEVYPMLTPLTHDTFHAFPPLHPGVLIFGILTKDSRTLHRNTLHNGVRMSFLQIPHNVPPFYALNKNEDREKSIFVPIESIIRTHIKSFFKNVEVLSCTLFRLTRNGDFTLEEDDIESNFLEELKRGLRIRRSGRVVRVEVEADYDERLLHPLFSRWKINKDNLNILPKDALMNMRRLDTFVSLCKMPEERAPIKPLALWGEGKNINLFDVLKHKSILLHHPYNSFSWVVELLEQAAEDPYVLSIKITLYRVSRNSRVLDALIHASEKGKHVSVIFELRARFDEERNMRQVTRLQKAGCYVSYGMAMYKTHAKMMIIVRKDAQKMTCYVHIGSGNYNESTAKSYSDIALLSTSSSYVQDVTEFFNVITGHSYPKHYQHLITSPTHMRKKLLGLIAQEIAAAKEGKKTGISFKINALNDKDIIQALYHASEANVPIKLIVRGICCLRPGRKGLSRNISVRSIVGHYLEHERIYYFHNNEDPLIYIGSADGMMRSYDRRIECLLQIKDEDIKKQCIYILYSNLRDNQNAYQLGENGHYSPVKKGGEKTFNIHEQLYKMTPSRLKQSVRLF